MKFTNNIRKLRLKAKLTPSKLASLMGVHRTAVHQWESSKNDMTYQNKVLLAEILGCKEIQLKFIK